MSLSDLAISGKWASGNKLDGNMSSFEISVEQVILLKSYSEEDISIELVLNLYDFIFILTQCLLSMMCNYVHGFILSWYW